MAEQDAAQWWPKVKELGPKSIACIFDIWETKMPVGETLSLRGQRVFCQGRGEVSSPANDLQFSFIYVKKKLKKRGCNGKRCGYEIFTVNFYCNRRL